MSNKATEEGQVDTHVSTKRPRSAALSLTWNIDKGQRTSENSMSPARPRRNGWTKLSRASEKQLKVDSSLHQSLIDEEKAALNLLNDMATLEFEGGPLRRGSDDDGSYYCLPHHTLGYLFKIDSRRDQDLCRGVVVCIPLESLLCHLYRTNVKSNRRPTTDDKMVGSLLGDKFAHYVDESISSETGSDKKMSMKGVIDCINKYRRIGQRAKYLIDKLCPGVVFLLPSLRVTYSDLHNRMPFDSTGKKSRRRDPECRANHSWVTAQADDQPEIDAALNKLAEIGVREYAVDKGLNKAMDRVLEEIERIVLLKHSHKYQGIIGAA